ncbi:MAG TPA: FHA domain-containing protein [Dehalococcoidia bacterium]|nr:FHA domain-containing protein [Dehalococcoidia bacterium]
MTARLLLLSSDGWRQEYRITGVETIIGRAEDCEIVLDYASVSRQHARVERDEADNYTLVDCGSTNGTFLNGRRLAASHRLNNGDQFTIGNVNVRFVDGTGANAVSTVRGGPKKSQPIWCDPESWTVWLNEKPVEFKLSAQEFQILDLLTGRYGQVCGRDQLGDAIWGRGNYDINMLHRLVHRLKEKLGDEYAPWVVSVPGVGYKIEQPTAPV